MNIMIDQLTQNLLAVLEKHKALGIAEQIDYQKFYLYSLVTHSTAIEGSTVTEIENQLLFDEGITPKTPNVQELMMNIDLKKAYEYSMQLAHEHADFSIDMLKELSAMVMKNTDRQYFTAAGNIDASKGDLRLVDVTAGPGGRFYMHYQKIPAKLEELCQHNNEHRRILLNQPDVIEAYHLSFDAHCRLVTIHPWVDGNGRIARLVMNHLQYEFGLIPTKIKKENKAEYIQALMNAQEQESPEPFRRFMIREHAQNLEQEILTFEKSL